MMTIDQLCNHIIYFIHTPIHKFNQEGKCIRVYIDHGELPEFFADTPVLLKELLEKKHLDYPMIHLECRQIAFGIVGDRKSTYVIGPCCIGQDISAAVYDFARKNHIDAQALFRISKVSLHYFTKAVIMLFEMLTGRTMDEAEIWMNSFQAEYRNVEAQKKIQEVFFRMQEESVVHNPYAQELREQKSIEVGDLDALYDSFKESYIGRLGTLSHDRFRNEKDLSIVVIALSSRSAIRGGILPEIAFTMVDGYVQELEEISNVGEAYALTRKAQIDFCRLVKEQNRQENSNPIVLHCKKLILQRLHKKIRAEELAKELKVNISHLSRLFAKEEGMTLTDYIAKEKVEYSKKQLIFTEDSFSKIAYSYGFSSQSHFGQVFKKWTGVTPRQFKEQNKDMR